MVAVDHRATSLERLPGASSGAANNGAMEFSRTPARPTGIRRLLFRAPILLYRAGLGGLLGSRFVLIKHIGRKTGLVRHTVVEVVGWDNDEVTVAAGFGPGSDWYRNLLAHPDTTIQIGPRKLAVNAERLPDPERGEAMLDYAHRHRRAALGLARFMGFTVDGSDADYRAMGIALHMLRFKPRA